MSKIKDTMCDPELMAEQTGQARGHQEAMQEVLGYLLKTFDEYIMARDMFMNKTLCESAVEYHNKAKHIKVIVGALFGEEEVNKMKTIY